MLPDNNFFFYAPLKECFDMENEVEDKLKGMEAIA